MSRRALLSEVVKPRRVRFGKMHPSPEIPEAIRKMTLFHGIENGDRGEEILRSGQLVPSTYGVGSRWSGHLTPRDDKVYLSQSRGTALSYAMRKHGEKGDYPWNKPKSQYSYLFQVNGTDLNHAEADEDDVRHIYKTTHEWEEYPQYRGQKNPKRLNPEVARQGQQLISPEEHQVMVTRLRLQRLQHIGKKLARKLPPHLHHDMIIRNGANVAHGGPVKITGAWRIHKDKLDQLGRHRGDELPDYAEPIHHLIGHQESSVSRADQLIQARLTESNKLTGTQLRQTGPFRMDKVQESRRNPSPEYGYHVLWHHRDLDKVRRAGLSVGKDSSELHFTDNEEHAREYEHENSLTLRFPRRAAGEEKKHIWPCDDHWTTTKAIQAQHIEYRDRTTGAWRRVQSGGAHNETLAEYILSGDDPLALLEAVIQRTLNPRFWDQSQVPPRMKPEIRRRLLQIAQDFLDGMDAHSVEPEDIVLTGSSANYNWTPVSDLDLHILVDFKKHGPDQDMAKEYFHDATALWNEHHSIDFFGHEIEVYVQDTAEPHVASGVYSLTKDKWRKRPMHAPEPDMTVAAKKAAVLTRRTQQLDRMVRRGNYTQALPAIEKLRDRIRNMRSVGLHREGEFAPENLAFKLLRRNGSLEKLRDASRLAYDRSHSLSELRRVAGAFLQEIASLRREERETAPV